MGRGPFLGPYYFLEGCAHFLQGCASKVPVVVQSNPLPKLSASLLSHVCCTSNMDNRKNRWPMHDIGLAAFYIASLKSI